MRKDGKVTFVQCKHWKTNNVGVKVVRELYGVMKAKNADRGIVVTYGSFTQDACAFAKGKPLELVDGKQLLALIEEVQKDYNAFKRQLINKMMNLRYT